MRGSGVRIEVLVGKRKRGLRDGVEIGVAGGGVESSTEAIVSSGL